MQLIPAIDLRDGRCVRLLKGDFDRETRYDVDPVALAGSYRAIGADWLHVVDLDGAASGRPVNLETIETIAAEAGLRIQLGGGIRDEASLALALDVADRVVVGSLAAAEPDRVGAWMAEHGAERFALGFDVRLARDGAATLMSHGWTRTTALSLSDAIEAYLDAGLKHVLCTDIDRDGALTGPNAGLYKDCVERWPDLAFQASGGVRDAGDLARLAETGVAAAISGKALLERRMTTEELRPYLPNA